jgi:hypothetical protein
VSSAKSVRERDAVKRYLEQLDAADEQEEVVIDPSAVEAALEKLRQYPEPEARLMHGHGPAYNVQTARHDSPKSTRLQRPHDWRNDDPLLGSSLATLDSQSGAFHR